LRTIFGRDLLFKQEFERVNDGIKTCLTLFQSFTFMRRLLFIIHKHTDVETASRLTQT